MHLRPITASDAPAPASPYPQALEVSGSSRLLFISGQIPVAPDGQTRQTFADQCRQAWSNVEAQLRAAGMTVGNLVKVNIFLADRAFVLENRAIRLEMLGDHQPALTVIITGIFDESWLIEIEAVAAA